MYLNNDDLAFLIRLENRLGSAENWSADVLQLWELIERLIKQQTEQREKARLAMAAGRKRDPNYGRGKKKGAC